jgi:hypothetical protein
MISLITMHAAVILFPKPMVSSLCSVLMRKMQKTRPDHLQKRRKIETSRMHEEVFLKRSLSFARMIINEIIMGKKKNYANIFVCKKRFI